MKPSILGVVIATLVIGYAVLVSHAQQQPKAKTAIAVGRDQGSVRWLQPDTAADLGAGALLHVKIDRLSVPHTTLMVATETLAASGIPVHSHTWEDELIYVIKGRGFAVIDEANSTVPIESGSVLYIPIGAWHGLRNADPMERMEVLLVTTPVKPQRAWRLLPLCHRRAWTSAAKSPRRGVSQAG